MPRADTIAFTEILLFHYNINCIFSQQLPKKPNSNKKGEPISNIRQAIWCPLPYWGMAPIRCKSPYWRISSDSFRFKENK